jgi:hypothetical protein
MAHSGSHKPAAGQGDAVSLDVNTPRGQLSVAHEKVAVEIFNRNFPDYVYLETPKDLPADIDAILTHKGEMRQVVETKCRYDCDLNKFMGQYRGQWLVTHDKIVRAMAVAKSLQVGVMGFLYIVPSQTLLVQPLVSKEGHFLTPLTIKTTQTQATVNGGKATRSNAFIDMTNARFLK